MRLLSPKELADALGVSESSLKRWTDAGRLRAARTGGGHRRIPLDEALRFIRATGTPVARPELLDLPELDAVAPDVSLYALLEAGDARAVRGWLMGRYLAGASVADLCDGPLRAALYQLGELWRHGPDGIVVEHRATDVCLQAIAHLRGTFEAGPDAPLAIGAGPEDDPYLLPAAMAAAVLASAGMRVTNLGADTPLAALERAVADQEPALVWISATASLPPARGRAIGRYLGSLPPTTVAVIGGQHRATIPAEPGVRVLGSMRELAAVAAEIPRPARPRGGRTSKPPG